MDYQAHYKDLKEWHKKASCVHAYHHLNQCADERWSIKNTAMYFGISIGLTSENINLSKAFDRHPELMECKTRQEALDALKEMRKNV